MWACETTGRLSRRRFDRISSDMQLLRSRDRELFEGRLQDSDSHEASEQVAGPQLEAFPSTARGDSEAYTHRAQA